MWKKHMIALLISVVLLQTFIPAASAAGDFLDEELSGVNKRIANELFPEPDVKVENEEDEPKFWQLGKKIRNSALESTFETILEFNSSIIIGVVKFFGLQDPGQLIFHNGATTSTAISQHKSNAVYDTFPRFVWNIIDLFVRILKGPLNYALMAALVVWAFLLVFRSETVIGQYDVQEMTRGFLTFFIMMIGMNYLIQLFFDINQLIVSWAKSVVESFSDSATGVRISVDNVNFLHIFGSAANGKVFNADSIWELLVSGYLAMPIILLILIILIGLINYQYAVRMVSLAILIVIYPVVAFASIFPARQKAFDLWMREFASQVFMNGAHAIIWAFFFLMLYQRASFWILVPMLFSLPALTSLIRIMFGAQMPGGGFGSSVGGAMGMGTLMGAASLTRAISGKVGGRIGRTGRSDVIKGTEGSTVQPISGGEGANMQTPKQPVKTRMGQVAATGLAATGKLGLGVAAGAGTGMLLGAATGNVRAAEQGVLAGAMLGGALPGKGMELMKSVSPNNDIEQSPEDRITDQFNGLGSTDKQELQRLFPNVGVATLGEKPHPMATKLKDEVASLSPQQQQQMRDLFPRMQIGGGRSANATASQLVSEYANATPDIQKQAARMMPSLQNVASLSEQSQANISRNLLQVDHHRGDTIQKMQHLYEKMVPEQQARAAELLPAIETISPRESLFTEQVNMENDQPSQIKRNQPISPPVFED